jgi:hypothetical protein
VSAQKQAVKERRLTLRGQRIEIVSRGHLTQNVPAENAILDMISPKDQV